MEFTCTFHGRLWKYGGESSWWFISLPTEDAQDLDRCCAHRKKNFGSVPVTVTIGATRWGTSVFRDNTSNTYLLPVKAAVRKAEKLVEDVSYEVTLTIP